LNTTASFSVSGTYTLRLAASDSALSTTADVVVVVSAPPPPNLAPTVNAGPGQTITFPTGASLHGTASDDGQPNGSSLTVSWSKVSGPGTVVFVNANSVTASATFLSAGTYTLRLTATDGLLSSTSDVVIVVNPELGSSSTNLAPVVNAGADQTITLPSTASLTGTATDDGLPTGSTLTTSWSKASGPGTVTFSTGSSLNTTATFSLAGTYTLRLTASDGALTANDDVVVIVNAAATGVNQAPVVNAGADQTITLPSAAALAGSATDDGLPTGSTVTTSWIKVSGPGTVTFGSASTLNTIVAFSTAGTYTLRLTVSDGALLATDDIIVTVNAALVNQAPVVNAGADQIITLPSSAVLAGSATDDGLPSGGTLTRSWSKVSGPGTVTFGAGSSLSTSAAFSTAGTYTLRLTVNDSALSASDDVVVIVNPVSAANQAPVVNAGPDQTIALPASANLAGSAADDGLPSGTLTISWSKVSGPGSVVFVNSTSLNATATFLTPGSYTLRLTVTDGALSTSDDVVVSVNPCGAVVSGTVTVLANASDNVGVVGVQFKLDGANFGPNLTVSPYSVLWNTLTASNGCHELSVTALDAAGNPGSATFLANVSNP
jgi:PKD repeat protein